MKKQYYIYNVLTLLCLHITAQEQLTPAVARAQALYGPDGLNVGPQMINAAETVFEQIGSSSNYQQAQAAKLVVAQLQKKQQELEEKKITLEQADGPVPREFYHNLFVVEERSAYLEDAIKKLEPHSLVTYIYEHLSDTLSSWWNNTNQSKQLAQAVSAFMDAEIEYILHEYDKVLAYVVQLETYPLPLLIDTWGNKQVQHILTIRSSRLLDDVEIAMWSIVKTVGKRVGKFLYGTATNYDSYFNMYSEGIAMFGGTAALEMVDKESAKAMKTLGAQMAKANKNLSNFSSKLQQEQKETFSTLINTFIQKGEDLNVEKKQEQQLFQNELVYLTKSVAGFALGSQMVNQSAILYDQLFEISPMITPMPGPVWYNPFFNLAYYTNIQGQTVVGDWQYDQQSNGFWQQALVPFDKVPWNDTKALDPAFNSIFTEYIPPVTSGYDIEIECTLIQCSYPFFAGIMFNKARWLSGAAERISQYRLLGLYGKETTPGDPKTRSIDLCFAQQKLNIPDDPTKTPTITSPLEQIMTDKNTALYTFSENAVTKNDSVDVERNPQTYLLRIKTLPDSVSWTLLKKPIDPQQDPIKLKDGTLESLRSILNPDAPQDQQIHYSLFRYHGIGFMSPGAQAAFTITKPTSLVYSQKARDAFKQTNS